MLLRYVFGATVVVFGFGLITVAPASAQARRDGSLLPQNQSGTVTAVGCLVAGKSVRGGKDNYVLARPRRGPVDSVPDGSCTADPGADALQLDNEDRGVTKAMIGRWVQISGRLESETDDDPDNLRELDVASVKIVPVVVPRQAVNNPPPAPVTAAPRPAPLPAPEPAAPAFTPAPPPPEPARTLPHTAGNRATSVFVGLLLLGSALTLRAFRLRHNG